MNDYFAFVGRSLAEKLSQSLNDVNLAKLRKLNVAELTTASFELRTIILQQICALKRNKAELVLAY